MFPQNFLFLSLLVALWMFCTTIILGLSSDVSLGILFFFWVRFPRPLICISIFGFILCVVKFHVFKSKLHWQNDGEDHH